MVIFHSYVNVYQRVNLLIFDVDLVGGIPTPLKNMRKSVGVTISIFLGKTHVPNHQPEIDMIFNIRTHSKNSWGYYSHMFWLPIFHILHRSPWLRYCTKTPTASAAAARSAGSAAGCAPPTWRASPKRRRATGWEWSRQWACARWWGLSATYIYIQGGARNV